VSAAIPQSAYFGIGEFLMGLSGRVSLSAETGGQSPRRSRNERAGDSVTEIGFARFGFRACVGLRMNRKPRRILLKFGSGILTRPHANALDEKQFRRLTTSVAQLVRGGCQCIIVSSGAVAAGMRVVGLKERPLDLTTGQACAAVGQSKLMHLYASMFAKHRLNVAQLLLTHGDLDSRTRQQNAKNTLRRLLQCKNVVPVINENDSVAVEELRFGDNDRLSAEVAVLAEAELLIMLTSVEGLMDHAGKRIPVILDVADAARFVRKEKDRFSVGGMVTKLEAVKLAIAAGIPAVIANGRRVGIIPRIVAGERVGTLFPPRLEKSNVHRIEYRE
jgi:glutamate 5-kinase